MVTEAQTKFDNDYYKSLIPITENNKIYLYTVGYEQSSSNNTEAFITKRDTNGNLIWQRKIDKSKDDIFHSITSVIENNAVYLYVAGWKNLSTDSNTEAFITKWDTNGNLVWQKRIDEPGDSKIYSITFTIENNVVYLYAVGWRKLSTDNNIKALITKWDTSGNLIWQRKTDESNNDYFNSIISTIENNTVYLYAIGCEYSSTDVGKNETLITKWDSNGNLIWQRKIDGSSHDYFNSITSTIESNAVYLYAVGCEYSSTNDDKNEVFITKWDSNGDLIWQRKISGYSWNYFYSIISTVENNKVYLYAVGTERSPTGNNNEAVIIKWDTNGNLIWQRKVGEINYDYFHSITSSIENDAIYLYAVGTEYSSANNNNEALITKWDAGGNLIWQRKIGGFNADIFYSITSTVENDTVYSQSVEHEVLSNNSNHDNLITKWNTNKNLAYQI